MQNVMIVDDEEDIVELMSETLDVWGYHPIVAHDGEEALEKFKEQPVDLVITDLRLPKMDGVRLLDEIKEIDDSTEVILFTGYPAVDSAIDAMKFGAFDYITKPVDLAHLRMKVEQGIEKKLSGGATSAMKGLGWAVILSVPIWLLMGLMFAYMW